jgi:anti-sigma-K factor RskA
MPAPEGGKPVKVFAVTLEPAAGVAAPTGPMVLASTK